MFRYSLELVVFLSGACVMILELTGSRILAPYLGTSIFVWTSLIGIILASLSLGYWLGGRLSDRKPSARVLGLVLFFSAIWCGLLALWSTPVLEMVIRGISDVRTASVLTAILLFSIPGVLMGMVSPYTVRLKISTVDHSGTTVGNLYAISTIGSITGTFLAGFVLIAHLSNPGILGLLFVVLLASSFLASPRALLPLRASAALIVGLAVVLKPAFLGASARENIVDVNTPYTRAWVYDHDVESEGQTLRTRFLRIGNENSGAMFLDYWDLVYEYTRFFHLAYHFKPDLGHSLMIGGGAYSFPNNIMYTHPEATMDVVEIDPKVTDIARRYFYLSDDPRLRVFHEDGRVFLNRNQNEYDAVYLDAFRSYYDLPYHLATREAMETIHRALADDGVLCINTLGALEGDGSELLSAVHATVRSVFPQVYIFPVQDAGHGEKSQNVILVALKSADPPSFSNPDPSIAEYLSHQWKGPVRTDVPILRDSFAPVERYLGNSFPKARGSLGEILDKLAGARLPEESEGG